MVERSQEAEKEKLMGQVGGGGVSAQIEELLGL